MDGVARESTSSYGRSSTSPRAAGCLAYRSHQLAAHAWEDHFYDGLVKAVPDTELTRDEGIRADTTLEKLATLQPSFRTDGTITAGNASSLNDGASALLTAPRRQRTRSAANRSPASRAAERRRWNRRCSATRREAAEMALGARNRVAWVGAVELNEAFAVQSLAASMLGCRSAS